MEIDKTLLKRRLLEALLEAAPNIDIMSAGAILISIGTKMLRDVGIPVESILSKDVIEGAKKLN